MSQAKLAPWQVWLVDFGVPVGNEQGGRRPAIVISSPARLALQSDTVLAVPVTSRDRGWPHHVPISPTESGLRRPSWARTEDLRSVSTRRFTAPGPVGALTAAERDEVRRWLRRMIDF